jgi:hypothetical protein
MRLRFRDFLGVMGTGRALGVADVDGVGAALLAMEAVLCVLDISACQRKTRSLEGCSEALVSSVDSVSCITAGADIRFDAVVL